MDVLKRAKVARRLFIATLAAVLLSGCATNHASTAPRAGTLSSLLSPVDQSIAVPAVATPPKGKMTLAQVINNTIGNNPDIGIARSQLKDAQANVGIAQAPLLPSIDYNAAIGPEHTYAYDTEIGTNATRKEASIHASQLLFDFGKAFSDVDWAKSLKDSASLRLEVKTEDILSSTIEAYLGVLELDMQIANSQANVAAHQEMFRIVTLNEQGGNGTKADAQKASTRLEAAKAQTLDLQAQRRTAASTFERVTGWAPGNLQMPNPPPTRLGASDAEIARYAATNPQLLSFQKDKASLEYQIRALTLDYLPKVTLDGTAKLQVNVSGVTPQTADARAMLSVGGPLFDGGDRISKIQQLQARIEETQYRYQRAMDDLKFDLGDAGRVLQTASAKLANIAGRIASSEDVVKLYTQQFQGGTRTVFELLDAQQELSSARSEQITARFDVLRAKYHMLRLTGALTAALTQ